MYIKYIIKPFKIAEEELLAGYKSLTVDSVTYQTNRKTNFWENKFEFCPPITEKQRGGD